METKDLVRLKVRKARQELGITQGQAAQSLGVSQQTWASYESGRIAIRTDDIEKIAQVLDRPVTYFVSDESSSHHVEDEIRDLACLLSPQDRDEIKDIIKLKLDRSRGMNYHERQRVRRRNSKQKSGSR